MKIFKKVLKILLIVILAILLVVGGYFAYVFIAYHRLGDMDLTPTELKADAIAVGTEYKIVSYNIGFGAYEADYGFFMDGGSESRAWSKERLDANLKNIKALLDEQKADLYLMQEVDIDSTRTYGVDERTYFNFENKLKTESAVGTRAEDRRTYTNERRSLPDGGRVIAGHSHGKSTHTYIMHFFIANVNKQLVHF